MKRAKAKAKIRVWNEVVNRLRSQDPDGGLYLPDICKNREERRLFLRLYTRKRHDAG